MRGDSSISGRSKTKRSKGQWEIARWQAALIVGKFPRPLQGVIRSSIATSLVLFHRLVLALNSVVTF
jgi:hypothetical protein